MKITSVEPQKKNIHRFNIFLDGQFAFGADEDLIVERRLVVGKEVNGDDVEKIISEAEVGKLMERVYGLSNFRMRSEKEIRDYLKSLSFKRKLKGEEGISDLVISSVIDRAKRKGLINDQEFVKAWVESRIKKYGVNRIKQELFQKGIDRETMEEVLSIKYQVSGEEEIAAKLLEKKMRVWQNLPEMKLRKKAYEYLMRRGFEYSLIKEVVEKVLQK